MSLTKERKKELIGAHRRGTADTGSAEIQIALLTGRISHLTDHFKKHSKDFASRRGLLMMVSRRRRLLDYLKRIAPQRYLDIIRRLEIRKERVRAARRGGSAWLALIVRSSTAPELHPGPARPVALGSAQALRGAATAR